MPSLPAVALPLRSVWRLPKRYTLPILGVAILAIIYGCLYIPTAAATFSYHKPTCIPQLTMLPRQQVSISPVFSFYPRRMLAVNGHALLSFESCFVPLQAPNPGTYTFSWSPQGFWLGTKAYSFTILEPPDVSTQPLNRPVALSKPLELPIESNDLVFGYELHGNNATSSCGKKDKSLSCPLSELKLEQGEQYEVTLMRTFNHKPVAKVTQTTVEVLKAMRITSSSIKNEQLVYEKPKNMSFTTDKPIKRAEATLTRLRPDEDESLPVDVSFDAKTLEISWGQDLPRLSDYQLEIVRLEATDGSTIEYPYVLTFATSGGPRISGVNIGRGGVSLGATAIITFDQPLKADQAIAEHVAVSKGSGSATIHGNTIHVSLSGIARCTPFTISIDDDVLSNYGVGGNSRWQYQSRTICHTSSTIGYSSEGRPIVAYYFGSGPTTILYTGTIHGNEVSAKRLLDRWIDELEVQHDNIPPGRQIVVVPVLNPDGYARGSRFNAHGVDLNRNFAVSDWKSNITDTSNRPLAGGGGSEPMSEPEAKAIANLTSKLRPRLTMSYHSIGGLVIANQAADSNSLANTYVNLSGYWNSTGQSDTTFEYQITGTYDDWIAEKLGLASVLVELGSHTDPQWHRNVEALWEMARR